MKTVWKIAGIATLVAILGVAVVGTVAFAQDDDGLPFDFGQRFREAIASALGVSVEEYDAAVEKAQGQVVDEAQAEGWLTEEQAERMRERAEQGFGLRGMDKDFMGPRGMDKGFRGLRGGFMGRGGNSITGMIADELDMSAQDLFAELQDGKSIAEVASENGVDVEKVTADYLAQLEEHLMQAVEDGHMTQTQADWMLDQVKENLPDQLNKTWEGCSPGHFPGGGRPGRMPRFPGQSDA